MATAIATVTLNVTAAPAYIADLSPYAARQLAGTYAPASGVVTLSDATPSVWRTQGNVGVTGVISAWNSGGKSVGGTRMFVHGGGHGDTANNGMYIYEFAGTTRPTGWTQPLDITASTSSPPLRSGGDGFSTYTDGRPISVHTIDGTVYAHHNDTFYRFGGPRWQDGPATNACFKYAVASGTWTQLPNYPVAQGDSQCSTIYDPSSRKILVLNNGSFSCFFFRCDSDTFSGAKTSPLVGYYTTGAYDTARSRGILVGEGNMRLLTIDWSAETVSITNLTGSGSTLLIGKAAPGIVYDSVCDCYWLFGSGDGASIGTMASFQTLYRMNAGQSGTTWTISSNTVTGASVTAIDQRGFYGRFALLSSYRAIGLCTSHSAAPYVIRLPSS